MTDLRTAAQQALERLRQYHYGNGFAEDAKCIADLEAALAQQAEPVEEPVYKVKVTSRWHDTEPLAPAFSLPDGEHLLYAAPPQRRPLTEGEIESCRQKGYAHAGLGAPFDFGKAARAVERAHGIEEQS